MLPSMPRALRLLGVLGLIVVMQAWGTSACLFASALRSVAGVQAEAACCCCAAQDAQPAAETVCAARAAAALRCGLGTSELPGGEECPLCSTIGNGHELVPLGAGPDLPPSDRTGLVIASWTAPESADVTTRFLAERRVIPRPTPWAFCTTIALLR